MCIFLIDANDLNTFSSNPIKESLEALRVAVISFANIREVLYQFEIFYEPLKPFFKIFQVCIL